MEGADPRKWELSERNRRFLRSAYRRAMQAGLEQSDQFKVVEAASPETLQLEAKLISLMLYARSGEDVKTRGFGELT